MIAHKFLSAGAVGLFSGIRWPTPWNGEPASWVIADGALQVGWNGIHACRLRDLPYWLNDELWLVELAPEIVEEDRMLVARSGRLVDRVGSWTRQTEYEFGEACAWRARDKTVALLLRRSLTREAARLAECRELDSLAEVAAAVAEAGGNEDASRITGYVADAAGYTADVASYAAESSHAGAAYPNCAAWAGCAAYVAAYAAGHDLGADAAAAERRWQAAWLARRLALKEELRDA